MSTPEIAFKKSTITVTEYTVHVLIRPDVYDFIQDLPDHTFTATHGFKITCHDECNNELTSEYLTMDHSGRGSVCAFSNVQIDVEQLNSALNDLAEACGPVEWIMHGRIPSTHQKEPRVLSKIESRTNTFEELELFMRSDVFDWIESRTSFEASNGIIVCCSGYKPEYSERCLLLDVDQCRGKKIKIDSQNILSELDQVLVALKELKLAFLETVLTHFSDWTYV